MQCTRGVTLAVAVGGVTWEEGVASVELSENAGQAPHVDGRAVAQAQHDFWRAVEAALNVAVHLLPFKAAAAKVYHLKQSQA